MTYKRLQTRLNDSIAPSDRIEYKPLKDMIDKTVNILSHKSTRWAERQVEFKNQQKEIRSEIEMGLALGYISKGDAELAYRSLSGLNNELSSYSYLKNRVANKERVHRRMDFNRQRTQNYVTELNSIDDYVRVKDADAEPQEPAVVNLPQYGARKEGVLAMLGLGRNKTNYSAPSYTRKLRMAGKVIGTILGGLSVAVLGFLGGAMVNDYKADADMEALKAQQVKDVGALKVQRDSLKTRLETSQEQADHWHNKYDNAVAIGEKNNKTLMDLADQRDGLLREKREQKNRDRDKDNEQDLARRLGLDPILAQPQTLAKITYDNDTGAVTTEHFEFTGNPIPDSYKDLKNLLLHGADIWNPSHPELAKDSFADLLKRNGIHGRDAERLMKEFSEPIHGQKRYDNAALFYWLLDRDKAVVTETPTGKVLITTPDIVDEMIEWVSK